jgi:hypothetical protein
MTDTEEAVAFLLEAAKAQWPSRMAVLTSNKVFLAAVAERCSREKPQNIVKAAGLITKKHPRLTESDNFTALLDEYLDMAAADDRRRESEARSAAEFEAGKALRERSAHEYAQYKACIDQLLSCGDSIAVEVPPGAAESFRAAFPGRCTAHPKRCGWLLYTKKLPFERFMDVVNAGYAPVKLQARLMTARNETEKLEICQAWFENHADFWSRGISSEVE